ncbi:nucleotide sugar dehydrogenase [Paenibacillus montanisoli]|uniref:UDP-N-acetyl-D-glucosamine dehydrogenase n=1 Tax=Paenibacillus montanisoli TaxID=2081970 RepID=A0A328U9T6_9BACL|nr:nucleotide sugar dehydrogenase [Paenibacillus montanisoli]RAP76796.1 UDP-N-acetyl-D-glucosamine dehydrogenase [Paenibacillus montanisoli]
MQPNELYKIAIIGLGYVGLPLARLFLENGHTVFGVDTDPNKIKKLQRMQPYLSDLTRKELKAMFAGGRFHVGVLYETIAEADCVILCVPTPTTDEAKPDLTFVFHAMKQAIPYLRPGQLLVLESSTYPGTTEEELQPLIEARGFRVGKDIFLAYSPERIDPGQKGSALQSIPKVVGGATAACTQYASRIYGKVFDKVVTVANARTAEMTKLVENCQRFVNISFMNDLVKLCEAMDINLWEVIKAAGTKPYGFMPYYPGPGVGGHCIPVDPMYLLWKAKQYGAEMPFIELSHRINEEMPAYIVDRTTKSLHPLALDQSSIMVIGATYKKDVNDLRESMALKIMELLMQQGAQMSFFDPYIAELTIAGTTLKRISLTARNVKQKDCLLILTDHSSIRYDVLAKHAKLIVDTRNATDSLKDKSNIVLL